MNIVNPNVNAAEIIENSNRGTSGLGLGLGLRSGSVPIEEKFESMKNDFEAEMHKTKSTVVEAKILIEDLKSDFQRFEERKKSRLLAANAARLTHMVSLKSYFGKSSIKVVGLGVGLKVELGVGLGPG